MVKNNKVLVGLSTLGAALLPLVTFAADFQSILNMIGNLIRSAIPIVMALALLYFFWGLARYILAADSDDAKAQGRNIMIWGIVALFVMASVWGLVNVLQSSFGINNSPAPTVQLPDAR
jgi:predicted membrane protein